MKPKPNKVSCEDWHLGWGYGGHDHIGHLFLNEDGSFTWKGHRQGRHLRIIKSKYTVTFKLLPEGSDDKIEYLSEHTDLPSWKEVKEAIDKLLAPPKLATTKKRKTKCLNTQQLTIF